MREQKLYNLPNGWYWKRIGEVVEINPPKHKPKFDDGVLCSFIPMKGLKEKFEGIEEIEERTYGEVKAGYTSFLNGDILFAKITPCMENGKVAIANGLKDGFGYGTTEFHIIRCGNLIQNQYLLKYLEMPIFLNEAAQNMTGTVGQKRVPKEFISNYYIPLPSINEQEVIANNINCLFIKLSQAKELLKEAKESFEKRHMAILYKAFTGELTKGWREENRDKIKKNEVDNIEQVEERERLYELPEGWIWVRLGDTGKLERGKSKHRPRNAPELFGGPYPFIQTGDVARANRKIVEHSQTLSEFGLKQSRLFPKGTVCITIAANIADTAMLTYDCCFPDSVVGYNAAPKFAVNEYILNFFATIKSDLEHYAPATAQKNINLGILNQIVLPLPTLKEQHEIVRIIDNFLNKEEELKNLLDLEECITLLEKSILSKAFRGKLVNKDIEDNYKK